MGYFSEILYAVVLLISVYVVNLLWKHPSMVEKNKAMLKKRLLSFFNVDSYVSVSAMVVAPSYDMLIRLPDSHKPPFREIVKAFLQKFLGDLGIFFHVSFHGCLLSSSSDAMWPHPFDRRRRRPRARYQSTSRIARGGDMQIYGFLL
jgi:hypothetical protein